MILPPPRSTLFPYTTLFRSWCAATRTTTCTSDATRTCRTTRCSTSRPSCRGARSEEHTSELQSHVNLVCRLLLEKKKKKKIILYTMIILIIMTLNLIYDDA